MHVVHLAAAGALAQLRAARADGVDVSVETCPHYLALHSEAIDDGATQFKCAPPIRDRDNCERLWEALIGGEIDMIVSDHSPCTPDLKRLDTGDFAAAWGGIASLELGLPVIWTSARPRGGKLADVVRWMATAPADRVGLTHKGRIAVGADADLVVFDPDAEFVVDAAQLHQRNRVSPYAGRRLAGVVRQTWLRGERVDASNAAVAADCSERTARGMSYYVPRGGMPGTDRAGDRPHAVHRGLRAAGQAHDARHRHQLSAVLGEHAAVGDRPTAVGVRGDVLAVHRRGRPGRRLRSPGIGPQRRGRAVRPRRDRRAQASKASAHALGAGGYAYLPPGESWTLHNREDRPASFHWIRKAYQRVAGLDVPEPVIANERDIEPVAMPDTDGGWATTRFVDPADLRHDMHVTIVTLAPGASIPFAETHVMEHGLYVLQGKALYLLNQDWVEVEAGDFMWLRAFCPQACCAAGPDAFRYLLYKDVNRHAPLTRAFV